MLIYAYADILGYRQMLRERSTFELQAILESAVTEMHRMLDRYANSKPVIGRCRDVLHHERKESERVQTLIHPR